jgi:D-alanine--poly(phosphoribitol) ligase subunit 1
LDLIANLARRGRIGHRLLRDQADMGEWMRLSGEYFPPATEPIVHTMFESHAARHPGRTAITCGPAVVSYGELDARANQFAHELASRGIGRGHLVGVCLDRSPELLVTILGTLKAGAGYVPLDPTYPVERLRVMTGQLATLSLVVASPATRALADDGVHDVMDVDAARPVLDARPRTRPAVDVRGDDVCYAVFTSGSTGTPKATAVRHHGWFNLLSWLAAEFDLDDRSANLMVSSFGFDISQRSLLTPLFTGATQHLLPSRNFDAMMAGRIIREAGVRTLHCAPSTLYLLIERDLATGRDDLASIEYVFVGGEPLSAGRVAPWATSATSAPGRGTLVNVYGVAECTDVSTYHVLRDYPRYVAAGVPIGRPIHNLDIHLLDSDLTPVAPGAVGEVCVSGIGVGVGYLNAPELTARRFVTARLGGDDVALYRTGDLGYVNPEGELMCVGRVDAQVKVRGMRIDLGDVETAVRANILVEDAVVLAVRPDGAAEADLVAFVIPAAPNLDERVLRKDLLSVLPTHMVPHRFVTVLRFPLTPNGKVDREALASATR